MISNKHLFKHKVTVHMAHQFFIVFIFDFYFYPPNTRKTFADAINRAIVKQVFPPASGDSKILLSGSNFIFWLFSFLFKNMTKI